VPQIGRYRILDELGRGASGVVYRAQDPAIGRIIAIKTIRLSDFTDAAERDRLRERLFREAQSAGVLSHPNIVTIYDIAEENGLAYIFMECVEGPPLEKVLNSPQVIESRAVLSILRQTATALDYAHKKGIVHRDIKPANILIHDGAVAKITDFGVAKILSQQMTHTGVMMGTPNYMSPEQVQGHAVDGRADQFSLAVIAYEVLTGEKPFLADQLPTLLFRIVREDPVPVQRLNPTLAPQVDVVFRKALAKSAGERYLNCVDFVEDLASALNFNPGWHALPRRGAQSLPTLGGVGLPVEPRPSPGPLPRPVEPVSAPRAQTSPLFGPEIEKEERNPVLKSLVWMLVGIGLVGLVLFGAQKYLFNRNTEPSSPAPSGPSMEAQAQPPSSQPPAQQSATPSAVQPPASDDSKPSPVGEPSVPSDSAQPPPGRPNPPESTAAETANPQPPEKPKETPRQRASIPPPVSPPSVSPAKPGASESVQFVTDPPNAQLTLDGNSSQACKTPCMLPLSNGRHSLNVQLDGYRPYPRVFNVPQEREIFLQLSKAGGTLSVTSNPPGATIEINGELQPKRTPAMFNYPPGTYRVRVARNGASLDFDVQLRDGEFVNKKVDF
jgi:serine/threonine protein kinase